MYLLDTSSKNRWSFSQNESPAVGKENDGVKPRQAILERSKM